jgi:hypothetical protein
MPFPPAQTLRILSLMTRCQEGLTQTLVLPTSHTNHICCRVRSRGKLLVAVTVQVSRSALPNYASSGMLLLGAAEDAPVPLTNACQWALCAIDLHFYWQEVTTSFRETFVIGA